MLMAAPLCVVAIAASVAVASPSDAEKTQGPKLDKLHAERPTAAIGRTDDVTIPEVQMLQAVADLQKFVVFAEAQTTKRILDEFIASVVAEEAARAAAPQQVSSSVFSNSNPGDFLSCVRQRESGGNYAIYNSGGSGAAGAYQFMQGTWNSIASSTGRGDLVGLDPAQAAPADQDAMAAALYAQQGSAPWGGAC
jgi:hypothetical protein